jgi:3-hydroxy-9,10-secoandrosta-1,3,5(10)-triene-9,17-dione monooxygenase reductase component
MADALSSERTLTPGEWRAAMGSFASGVTVVTTWDEGKPSGSTVSAFCSVSLDPPLLLVCLDQANPVRTPVEACGVFGVNILNAESRELALRFAVVSKAGRFEEAVYRTHPSGAPQLEAAAVFVDCMVEAIHPAGDHVIVVGRGVRIDHASSAAPLLYHRGGFPSLVRPE